MSTEKREAAVGFPAASYLSLDSLFRQTPLSATRTNHAVTALRSLRPTPLVPVKVGRNKRSAVTAEPVFLAQANHAVTALRSLRPTPLIPVNVGRNKRSAVTAHPHTQSVQPPKNYNDALRVPISSAAGSGTMTKESLGLKLSSPPIGAATTFGATKTSGLIIQATKNIPKRLINKRTE